MQAIPLQVVIPPDLLATLLRDQLPELIGKAVADVLPDMVRQAVAQSSTGFDLEDRKTRAAVAELVGELIANDGDAIVSAIEDTRTFRHAVESVVESCDLDENLERWVRENPGTIAESLRDNGELSTDADNMMEKVAQALRDAADNLS